MNSTQVMRFQPDPTGVTLRLWIDDDEGRHVTVSEMRVGLKTLRTWYDAAVREQQRADQPELPFDE